ncbi:hypothetical protein SAY86_024636 [Trapa natans]|uniref:Transcription repressor n=1 Tax=Trapa natans TaxID=22666 RepID=A0AAN7M5V4_TRANT|nr:hypothetical protein SAY86_024636 [Trapa natans]
MRLPLSKNSITAAAAVLARLSSCPWQAHCHRPKTLSFHSAVASLEENEEKEESIETVIRGAKSEGRVLFEPLGRTRSLVAVEELSDELDRPVHGELMEEEKGVTLYMVVESTDPYRDFRASMEEMVGAGQALEGLLRCFLSVNDRTNHPYILRAFVDLLLSSGHSHRRTRRSVQALTVGGDGGSSYSCCHNCDKKRGSSSEADINVNGELYSTTSSSPCSPLSFYTSSSSSCCYSSSGGGKKQPLPRSMDLWTSSFSSDVLDS